MSLPVVYAILVLRATLRYIRKKSLNISLEDLRISLFPTTISALYKYSRNNRYISSLSLLLLPPSWRIQLALYALTAAFKKKYPNIPPISLAFLGNTFLQWAFVFTPHAIPNSYAMMIYNVRHRFEKLQHHQRDFFISNSTQGLSIKLIDPTMTSATQSSPHLTKKCPYRTSQNPLTTSARNSIQTNQVVSKCTSSLFSWSQSELLKIGRAHV